VVAGEEVERDGGFRFASPTVQVRRLILA
jgi:hypothetical protein